MSDFATKRAQALEACDKVINGIEDETITVSSALLQCMKIARLVNDADGQEWLQYEYGGYPQTEDGHIVHSAWLVAVSHGRSYIFEKKKYIFTGLASELEGIITSSMSAQNNFTTQGFSASGEYALLATDRMTRGVLDATNAYNQKIQTSLKNLSILKSQYYDFAVKWKLELQFGKTAEVIFEEYQDEVDKYFSKLSTPTLQKLNAIENLMEDGNPERYSQVLTSCRRLWAETAKQLFDEVLPKYDQKTYKTKSGVQIDVSGEHFNNKLSAVIETLQGKAVKNSITGSEVIYLVDWIEQINALQSSGVHSDISRGQAMQCIIHTYIALGDILKLKESAKTV